MRSLEAGIVMAGERQLERPDFGPPRVETGPALTPCPRPHCKGVLLPESGWGKDGHARTLVCHQCGREFRQGE